jgi:glycosyltransferase involved in cell wall biosynthesis
MRLGLNAAVLSKKPGLRPHPILELRGFIKKGAYQLVHTHSIGSNFYGRLARIFCKRVRLATTVHADTISTLEGALGSRTLASLIHRLDLLMAALSDRVLMVSQVLGEKLINRGLDREKIVIVRSGIDLPRLEVQSPSNLQSLRSSLGIGSQERLVGTVGRLTPVKKHSLFLRAAREIVQNKDIPVKFLIVGDGPLRRDLEDMAIRLRIRDRVIFTGWREDLEQLYPLMDIFVLSSEMEGLPITLLEAMAYKRPVVATCVGEIPRVIQDGQSGLLVPNGDSRAMSSALLELLDDSQRCFRMGEIGRKIVEEQFTLERMYREVEKVYLDLLSEASRWAR